MANWLRSGTTPVNILALDLGTKTGYAIGRAGCVLLAGTEVLATPAEVREWHQLRLDRRADPRITRLFDFCVAAEKASGKFDAVVFEDVEFAVTLRQCQLWSSLRAAVWLAFDAQTHLLEAVPVGTLKKFATGNGTAKKADMAAALCREKPNEFSWSKVADRLYWTAGKKFLDDNAVDALQLHRWASRHLAHL